MDEITRQFVNEWGSNEVPTAKVVHGKVRPGPYYVFALLGWLEARRRWPVVGLRLALLQDDKNVGAVNMGLPLTPKTERHVCGFLQDLGWDGRVWPHKDHGWPEGTHDELNVIGLLRTANLGSTLTFVPNENGEIPTVLMDVAKNRVPFLTAPFHGTVPKHLEALRALASDRTPFTSDWDKTT